MSGQWMQTFTGRAFWITGAQKGNDVCLEDVAHHLATINRYNGASVVPWSVAHHSLLTWQLASIGKAGGSPTLGLVLLLHDAHEAYTGDRITPWKRALEQQPGWPTLRELETDIKLSVRNSLVKLLAPRHAKSGVITSFLRGYAAAEGKYDMWALSAEKEALLNPSEVPWEVPLVPVVQTELDLVRNLMSLDWAAAKQVWLTQVRRLASKIV